MSEKRVDQKSASPRKEAFPSKLRRVGPIALLAVAGVAFVFYLSVGTPSAFGWMDLSLLCPLGALEAMLASKLMVPQVLISVVCGLAVIVLVGRAFCAWLCPVPLVEKLRGAFSRGKGSRGSHDVRTELRADSGEDEGAEGAVLASEGCDAALAGASGDAGDADVEMLASEGCDEAHESHAIAPLSHEEQGMLKTACAQGCAENRKNALDSRHVVLGGALLSSAIFGFPVFCLICPVGLSFATLFLIIRAFGYGDVTAALLVVPVVLLVEVVFFKKWCHKICPLGALMSLVAKLNRTFRPAIDDKACLETSCDASCGVCGRVCPEGIDIRHPELSEADLSECTRCRACVDACPKQAITLPVMMRRS